MRTAQCSAVVLGVVVLNQLRLGRALSEALRLGRGARRQEPQLALQVEQLLICVGLHFDRLELLEQRVARQILVHLGRRDELALFVLDLLRHLLERLERALVADRRHRFLNALVRLGTLLARDQDVLLALGFLDPIVELAQRYVELVRFLAVLAPRIVQLQGGLLVLVVAGRTCRPLSRLGSARQNLTAPRTRRVPSATDRLAPLALPRVADPRPSHLPPTAIHPAYSSESAPRAPRRRECERPNAGQE